MKKIFTYAALAMCSLATIRGNAQSLWTSVAKEQAPPASLLRMPPAQYSVYKLDVSSMMATLWALPSEPEHAQSLTLPMPGNTWRTFRVWQASMMPDELAARFPGIRTFTGIAADDPHVTIKLDFTLFGFHAAVFDGDKISFVDPYDNLNDGFYIVHDRADEVRAQSQKMVCAVKADNPLDGNGAPVVLQPVRENSTPVTVGGSTEEMSVAVQNEQIATGYTAEAITSNGTQLRTYRLALSANNYYCRAATGLTTPTIAQCLSTMTTSMNRVNGVYNREISVQLNFVTNENLLIWPTATGSTNGADPFDAINSAASSCLSTNQTTCDTRIGTANYDVGHVFTTGAGGLAGVGVICNSTQKARGVTGSSSPVGDGFDIDYVCHEMGHQFGSSHTFNNNVDGSCGGNASSAHAYEPGSGATIMDYAGICSPDNLQPHSDPYFSGNSLEQIQTHMSGSGGTCAVNTSTGHTVASVGTFTAVYTIPYKTPFELTGATATVAGGDTAITYCWYQSNLGDFGARLNQTYRFGPIFRSYQPAYTPTRVFPALATVLAGSLTNTGEKAADTARYMTFKMAVRNVFNGYGCFVIPDDTVHINAVSTGTTGSYAGFKVTSQGTTGISYTGGSTQTITWNVVGTNVAPVNAANVDIYMSADGGYTWPYFVGTYPNTGSASIAVPNPAATTTTARFKVKGNGNVFFNINGANFTVNPGATTSPITGTLTVCAGFTTTLADATTGGTWTSSTPGVAVVGSSTGVVTGIAAGTATITYNVASGNVTAVVTVSAIPVVSAITGPTGICIGGTSTYSSASSGGVWSSSNTAVATITSAGVATGVAVGTSVISYAVTNSCGTGYATRTVSVSAPTAVAPVMGATVLCPAATVNLTCATSGGVWSSADPSIATVDAAGVVTGVSAGMATISYSVTNASGCTSSASTIVTINAVIPSVSIDAIPGDTVCTGDMVTYAAVPVSGGSAPTYGWSVNGINVATGPTYSTVPTNGDVVVCTMTSNAVCASLAPVSSSPLVMTVQAPLTNSIVVSASSPTIGAGESVTFVAVAPNAGPGAIYQWMVDGVDVPGATTTMFTTTTLTNGQIVSCRVTSLLPCVLPHTVVSGGFAISVTGFADPVVTIGNLMLVPNPSTGTFTISGNTNFNGEWQMSVTNVIGQVVYRESAQSTSGKLNKTINLPGSLPSGSYYVTLTSSVGRVVAPLSIIR